MAPHSRPNFPRYFRSWSASFWVLRLVANDMRTLLDYAKHGLGLAYLYREIALPHLREGGLTEVLSGHVGQLPRYSLNYRSKRNMTRRLRAFVDMAKASRKAA